MKWRIALRWIAWCWGLGIGLVMIASGWIHLNNTIALHQSILEYRMVVEPGARALATLLPPLQFGIGVMIVVHRFCPRTLMMAGLLLAVFAIAQWRVVLSGWEISCGCFGPWSRKVTWGSAASITLAATFTAMLAWADIRGQYFHGDLPSEVKSC